MEFIETEITNLISTIWQSVLGMEASASADLPTAAGAMIAGCVQITGEWQGAVVLCCPESFAALAATIMFNTAGEDRNPTDMQDAVAELTNMIGGNLKGLLPVAHSCQLSLPAVVAGEDYTARVPGSRPLHRIVMNCAGQSIVVNVLEKLAAARAA